MTRAQRFAKYAAKMTEANQEQWSSKMKEKRANYLARMSEQQEDAMRKTGQWEDKYLTTIAMLKILSQLLLKHPTITVLSLFSDGAAQHFKQSFFFNAVTHLPNLLGVEHLKIIYDFFATSHGKGAVDGIGGSAKRGGNECLWLPIFQTLYFSSPGVMSRVLARKAIVKTAKDFAITGSAACPAVKFIYIGKAEVESKIKALDEFAFTRAGVRHRGIGDESQARPLWADQGLYTQN